MKILKFGLPMCGPCKVLDRTLETFDKVPVEYFDASDAENAELVADLKIKNVPAMVLVDKDNNVIDKKVGILTLDQLNKWISGHESR